MNIYTIYKASNLINGKLYIGFTQNYENRIKEHKKLSTQNKYDSAFHKAIRKYGWENFSWEILYQSYDMNHTKNEMENYFIVEYNTYTRFKNNNGYNQTLGGDGSNGRKCKDSTKQKIKEKAIERFESQENREKQAEATRTWWENLSEEKKQNCKTSGKGKLVVRDAASGEIIGSVDKNHENIKSGIWVSVVLGYVHSEDAKRRISESHKGIPRPKTKEQIEKFKISRKGKGTGENNSMASEDNRKKKTAGKELKKLLDPNSQ